MKRQLFSHAEHMYVFNREIEKTCWSIINILVSINHKNRIALWNKQQWDFQKDLKCSTCNTLYVSTSQRSIWRHIQTCWENGTVALGLFSDWMSLKNSQIPFWNCTPSCLTIQIVSWHKHPVRGIHYLSHSSTSPLTPLHLIALTIPSSILK